MKRLFALILMAFPAAVAAHADFEQPEEASGSYYKAVLGTGHGCNGSATTKVSIEIPEGIEHARPMPKRGWKIEIVRKPLSQPYESYGKTVTEDVRMITWYGEQLSDDHYGEFVFKAKVTAAPQTLYLPVRQTCISGENYWHQIPQGDRPWHTYEKPAPFLNITEPASSQHP